MAANKGGERPDVILSELIDRMTEANQQLLQTVYDYFRENGKWPFYRALEIKFWKTGPLHQIVERIDQKLMRVEDIYRDDAVCYLTLEGLAKCKGSEADIQNIIKTAALFARRYIEHNGPTKITSDEVREELNLTDLEVQRVCEMYWRFGWQLIGGGGRTDNGTKSEFNISRNALFFEDVANLNDFFDRIKKVQHKEEAERKLNNAGSRESVAFQISDIRSANPKKVFVVHGRNEKARKAILAFLRSIELEPIEWTEAISYTKRGAPYIGEILDHAFQVAQAVIVLITGDDIAKLSSQYLNPNDPSYERELMPQARPNVLFEAGLAFGRHPERTVLVELGSNRPFSDIAGRHIVKISNNSKARHELVSRLKTAGCDIKIESKTDWLNDGDFDGAIQEHAEYISNEIKTLLNKDEVTSEKS